MKKTWITRALTALITLALAAGVFLIAPSEARAEATITVAGSTSQTVTAGDSIATVEFRAVNFNAGETFSRWEADPNTFSGIGLNWNTSSTNPMLLQGAVLATAAPGTYTSTVKLYKNDASSVESYVTFVDVSITVTAPLSPPVFPPAAIPVSGTINQAITNVPAAVTSGNPAPTYTASDFPAGVTVNPTTGLISGTPTGQPGANPTVTATNSQGSVDKTINFTIAKSTTPPASTASASATSVSLGGTVTLRATPNSALASGVTYQWRRAGQNITGATGSTYSFTPVAADVGTTVSFDCVITPATTDPNYSGTSTTNTVSVRVEGTETVFVSVDRINLVAIGNQMQFTAYSSGPGGVVAYCKDPSVVSMSMDGTPQSGSAGPHTYTLTARKAGQTQIDIYPLNGSSSNYKSIYVNVGASTPKLSYQFWVLDGSSGSTTLNKHDNWARLRITVTNYNPSYMTLSIRRNNIRTYVQNNAYMAHPNTYDYTLQLVQDPGNPMNAYADAFVIPQYNGNTHYTAAYTGATSITTKTIYVTGYPALPQTGPDYTWAYVLGGLCLAAVATAITLNVKRKKKQQDN